MKLKELFYGLWPNRMARQVRELFASTILVNVALSMVLIFEPIYLYQQGYSLEKIIGFYLVTYVLYFLIMPLGAKFSCQRGYEMGIFYGTALFMAYYISLFLIAYFPVFFLIAPVIFALHKTFYWPAYHADFARFSDDQEEGREVSFFNIVISLTYILGPVLAGFIITFWGYGALFIVVSLIFLLSNVPTLLTKEIFVPSNFEYWATYKELFAKQNRRMFLAYVGFGEEFVSMTIWPIFISLIIIDELDIGLIVALAVLVTSLLTLFLGKLSDQRNRRTILGWGASINSLGWFLRMFIGTQFGVFFMDSLARLSRNIVNVPLLAITYENARRRHVMHHVVFFESGLVVGKILAILFIYAALFFIVDEIIAFKTAFVIAGGMSLLYLLLKN